MKSKSNSTHKVTRIVRDGEIPTHRGAMNRRVFLSTCFAGLVAAPSVVRALSIFQEPKSVLPLLEAWQKDEDACKGLIKQGQAEHEADELPRVFLLPSEYYAPDAFQLGDINTLLTKWRHLRGKATYTTLTLGRFEDEQFGYLAWQASYTREACQRMTSHDYYLASDTYWSKQWRSGNKYLPWDQAKQGPHIEVIDSVEHWCELT